MRKITRFLPIFIAAAAFCVSAEVSHGENAASEAESGENIQRAERVKAVEDTALVEDATLLEETSLAEDAYIYLQAVLNYQKTWNRLQEDGTPWETYGVRAAMDHAFCLAAAETFFRRHPDLLPAVDKMSESCRERIFAKIEENSMPYPQRIPADRILRLLELTREMQMKEFRSPDFGNFRWYFGQPGVEDWNAVEFVCQRGLPMWLEFRDVLTPEEQTLLRTILMDAAEGCRRHQVPSAYTNIALVNITNLILLGEVLEDERVLTEGVWRARRFLLWTWKNGITEYVTPTYYGVNLEALELLHTHAKTPEARQFAAAMLELLWTDIAANYHAPSGRLSGAHSRSYNYIYGTDAFTEGYFQKWKWDRAPLPVSCVTLVSAWQAKFAPDERLCRLNRTYPRTVVQKWSEEMDAWRTARIYEDITLSTSTAFYRAAQNAMLAVDIPRREHEMAAGKTRPRAYFIPDGRDDPYGLNRFQTKEGHQKALHMNCFWRAAQRENDAVCLAIYRPKDVAQERVTDVKSRFVFPVPDEMWLNGTLVSLAETPNATTQNPADAAQDSVHTLILRYGPAMLALRVLWSQTQDGTPARVSITPPQGGDDFMCLTVEHCATPLQTHPPKRSPAVALHARIGSALTTPEAQNAWRESFLNPETPPVVEITENAIKLAVSTQTGPVGLTVKEIAFTANFPENQKTAFIPGHEPGILRINGEEIGRPILEKRIDFIRKYAEEFK